MHRGICYKCEKIQDRATRGGIWLNGMPNKWICDHCRAIHNTHSYPTGCERCGYQNVKWYQGHIYECPRCMGK